MSVALVEEAKTITGDRTGVYFTGSETDEQAFARDQSLDVRFFKTARLHQRINPETMQTEPVVKEIVCVEVKFPGDSTKIVCEEVYPDSSYPRRFPHQWEAFQRGDEAYLNGKPLADTGLFSATEMAALQIYGFKTMEQLADANVHSVAKIGPGAVEWQKRAQRWMHAQRDSASQAKTIEELTARLAELEAKVSKPKRDA